MHAILPGFDPFIEDQEWHDFYVVFNVAITDFLAPQLSPHYVGRIQRSDIQGEDQREARVVIREVPSMEIVTVIETLSPANKCASSDGREQYLEKRQEILQSRTNLVELDLLRGGKRLPVIGMPPGDYYAIVSRGYRRPKVDVYAWTLRQPLPTIPIPLKKDEAEAPLDLQQVFTTVYDRARYHLSLNYAAKLAVPLMEQDATWLAEQLANRVARPVAG